MRLTVGQLRQVIKEEVARIRASRNGGNRRRLRENAGSELINLGTYPSFQDAVNAMEEAASEQLDSMGRKMELSPIVGEEYDEEAYPLLDDNFEDLPSPANLEYIAVLFPLESQWSGAGFEGNDKEAGYLDGCVILKCDSGYYTAEGGGEGWSPADPALLSDLRLRPVRLPESRRWSRGHTRRI